MVRGGLKRGACLFLSRKNGTPDGQGKVRHNAAYTRACPRNKLIKIGELPGYAWANRSLVVHFFRYEISRLGQAESVGKSEDVSLAYVSFAALNAPQLPEVNSGLGGGSFLHDAFYCGGLSARSSIRRDVSGSTEVPSVIRFITASRSASTWGQCPRVLFWRCSFSYCSQNRESVKDTESCANRAPWWSTSFATSSAGW